MREAVIVSAVRTAVGRAPRGCLRNTRPDDMAGWVVKEALNRAPGLKPEEVDDLVIGCSFPEAEQGLNVARLICYIAGLPYTVPGQTVNRFCSSGLQAIAIGAEHIMCGFADVIIAGGVESMSMVPMGGNKTVPNLKLVETYPEGYTAMGVTAENVARK
jgi:acetyl-CoA acyltransferase